MKAAICVVVALGAVVIAAAPAEAGTVHRDTTVAEVNKAGTELTTAITSYLQSGSQKPPTNNADWKKFFNRTGSLAADLSQKFKHWTALLAKARSEGHPTPAKLRRYVAAMKVWIGDQVEQARLSRGCYISTTGFASTNAAASCYAKLLSKNGGRWQADAERLNSLGSK